MRKLLFIALPFLAGVALLAVLIYFVDFGQALAQIDHIGPLGCAVFILNIGLTFLAPAAGWHLLLRADGIRISFGRTLLSALMGHAFNLITPMMYLGGEPIRTLYVAGAAGASKRQVIATIIVNKFQELAGLIVLVLAGTAVVLATHGLHGKWLVLVAVAVPLMLAFVVVMLCMFLGDVKPTVKLLDFCVRLGFFAEKLRHIRDMVVEMEIMVRKAFIQRWRVYIASQFLSLVSPLAQFVRPLLFYAFLRGSDAAVPLPSLADMAMIFVISQVVFMIPTTPAGLGSYELTLVGAFTLVGRPAHDGTAFGLLVRAADLLYIAAGAWLAVHYGLSSLLRRGLSPSPVAVDEDTPPTATVEEPPAGGATASAERRKEK